MQATWTVMLIAKYQPCGLCRLDRQQVEGDQLLDAFDHEQTVNSRMPRAAQFVDAQTRFQHAGRSAESSEKPLWFQVLLNDLSLPYRKETSPRRD